MKTEVLVNSGETTVLLATVLVVIFSLLFVGICLFTLRPRNKSFFNSKATLPLDDGSIT